MRVVLLLGLSVILSACSVYTLTNKTDEAIRFKRAGNESMETLEAGKCITLSEYLVGLDSDFPFTVVEGEDVEYQPNNYEIVIDANAESKYKYKVLASNKNPNCEKKEDQKVENAGNKIPVCENGKKIICNSENSEARCVKKEEKIEAICVDKEKGEPKKGVNPICGDSDTPPECKEKELESSFVMDGNIQSFCLNGDVVCSGSGQSKCIRENNKFIAVCLKDGKRVGNEKPYCDLDPNAEPQCVAHVQVTVKQGATVYCGDSQGAYCSNSRARMVCGTISTNPNIQPYCVNENNIRWNVGVRCQSGAVARCQQN